MMRTKILVIGGALVGLIILLILTFAVMSGGDKTDTADSSGDNTSRKDSAEDEKVDSGSSGATSDSCPPVASNVVVFCGGSFSSVTVGQGEEVVFLNNSNETVEPSSDPHPTHTKYTVLNIGPLEPGEQKAVIVDKTGAWGLHDHRNPSRKGMVTVQ